MQYHLVHKFQTKLDESMHRSRLGLQTPEAAVPVLHEHLCSQCTKGLCGKSLKISPKIDPTTNQASPNKNPWRGQPGGSEADSCRQGERPYLCTKVNVQVDYRHKGEII